MWPRRSPVSRSAAEVAVCVWPEGVFLGHMGPLQGTGCASAVGCAVFLSCELLAIIQNTEFFAAADGQPWFACVVKPSFTVNHVGPVTCMGDCALRYVPFPSYARVRNHRCISGTRKRQAEPSVWTNSRRRNELWMAGSAGGGWIS